MAFLPRSPPVDALAGHATADGTRAYAQAHPGPAGHYRTWNGLTVSSLGMGSYLGATTAESGVAYEAAALHALTHGVNVLDTAANYRDQRSERDLGRALHRFVAAGGRRDQVVLTSKAGFLHGDADQADPDRWFHKEYRETEILRHHDIVAGAHSMRPEYLRRELDRSLRNLGVEQIDVYFLHNPETQLAAGVPAAEFYGRVREAFRQFERAVDMGKIRAYGVATWDGLRVPPGHPSHLSLARLVEEAGQARAYVRGKPSEHHFRAIQLPVNLAMTEAALTPSQQDRMGPRPLLDMAHEHGFLVLGSASLVQARLAGRVPAEWKQGLGTEGDLETCLQFARSVPGVTTALVGMGRPEHAQQDVAWAMQRAPDPKTVQLMLGPGGPHG